MTDIDLELIKRLEALKFKKNKIGLNSLINEDEPMNTKFKSSPWITIKSVLATIITLVILSAGILLLPIILIILLAIIVYAIYKIFFTTKESIND